MGLTNKLNLKEGTPAAPSGCLLFPEMERGKWGMEQELATTACFKNLGGGVSCIRVILLLFPPN